MSGVVLVGFGAMFGALLWCAWSIVRVLIGPRRMRAARNAGLSVAAFLMAAAFVGYNLPPRTPPSGALPKSTIEAAAPTNRAIPTSPKTAAPIPLPRPAFDSPISVVARYHPSKTMVSLVLDGYSQSKESQLVALAAAECAGSAFCSVGFWTDDNLAPRKLKMTNEQMAARVGQYVRSPSTGLERFLWNCERSKHSSEKCLP